MRRIALTILIVVVALAPAFSQGNAPIDPDSLRSIQGEFKEVVDVAKQLSLQIKSPDDVKTYDFIIKDTKRKMEWLEGLYTDLTFKDDKISRYLKQYHDYLETIEEDQRQYQHDKTRDSIAEALDPYAWRFDSLLTAGQTFAADKSADSVRRIKEKARTWWGEICRLKDSNPDHFKENEDLREQYAELEQSYTAITDLSEQERMKLRDILLVAGVTIGVLTMIIGMVGSRIRERKLQKKAEEMPPYEL